MSAGAAGVEDGPATDGPAPIYYTMGILDGIRLKTGGPVNWRHPPCGASFASSTQNQAIQGNQLPLVTPSNNNDFADAPPVDGNQGSPKSMFMLAYNQSEPACCPSTYSSDRGCVCTTPAKRNWLARGGNWKGEADWANVSKSYEDGVVLIAFNNSDNNKKCRYPRGSNCVLSVQRHYACELTGLPWFLQSIPAARSLFARLASLASSLLRVRFSSIANLIVPSSQS